MSKKAILIGASSGIGKALAITLIHADYQVGITGRRTTRLNELKNRFPKNIFPLTSDVTSKNATHDLDQLLGKMGGVDLVIISSGIGHLNPKLDYLLEEQTNQVNVIGFTKMVNWAMHVFESQGYGHLVNISSVAKHRGGRKAPAYNASKAYQSNYLEGLNQKVYRNKLKILITDIRPGFVDTAMAQADNVFWMSSKEKAAKQIYRAILNKRQVAYISRRWKLIGWILQMIPRALYIRL